MASEILPNDLPAEARAALPESNAPRGLLAELRRRRVLRAAGAYVAGGFVVLQGADYLFRALLFPDWAFRVVVLVAALGFLIALPLAWVFDIGPGGVRRTPERSALVDSGRGADVVRVGARAGGRLRTAGFAAVLVLLAASAGGWLVGHRRGSAVHAHRLVVAPFENRTGDASLAPLGDMAADWITQGLTESGVVEVADGSAALAVSRQAATVAGMAPGDLVRLFSRETGAGMVVTGRYYTERDSVEFVAQVVDARSGKVVRVVGPVAAARIAPAQGAERLRQRLLAELAVMLDDRLARYQPLDSHPPTYDAYQEYLEGVRADLADDFHGADAHFSRAFALDTTFYRALVAAAGSALVFGDPARYDSLAAQVERRRDRLSPVDRSWLEWQHAYRAGDRHAMYATARRMTEVAPGSDKYLWELALDAGRVRRYRESLALLLRIDPDRGLARWKYYWAYVGGARHALADYEGELRAAAEMARRSPDATVPDALRLSALAALGRTDRVRPLALALAERLADDTVALREFANAEPLGFQAPAAGAPFLLAARELMVHGHTPEARGLAEQGVRWCATRTPAQQADPWARWVRAQLLGISGRWHEADTLLAGTAPPRYWPILYAWNRGLIAAELGDKERARAIARGLPDTPAGMDPYFHVTIAAALGDRADVIRRLRDMQAAGADYGEWWLHTEPTLVPYFREPDLRSLFRPQD